MKKQSEQPKTTMLAVTEEQAKFIADTALLMTSQSNRSTQFPLFYVYEIEERWVNDEASCDYVKWYSDARVDTVDIYTDEKDNEWVWFEKDNVWRCKELGIEYDEYEFEEKFETNFRKVSIDEVKVPVVNVGPFFTEEAAKSHIEANSYHYNKPFIYVNSAWRNWEMQKMLELIFTLAGKEVPAWYK